MGPPPIGAAGESLPVPQGWPCPDAGPVSAAAQRDPSGCREPSSRTPRGPSTRDKQTPGRHRRARGDTASSRDLKGSERRRDPCRPFSADPSATRDARKRLGSSAQNRFLSLRRREHPAGTHFFLVFLRLPPPPHRVPYKQQKRLRRRKPTWCPSARPRALLFVSFHRSRAASGRLTGGGDASAAQTVKLRGYEVRAPGHRRRHAWRQDVGRRAPGPRLPLGPRGRASGEVRPRARGRGAG